jgi:hypothetical protein
MATKRKQTKPSFNPNMMVIESSDVISLPTIRGVHVPTISLVPTRLSVPTKTQTRKPPVQAKVPVKVGDKSYQSICAMMKGEGIQDMAKMGLDNNWSKIRNSLKKTGACTWNFSKDRYITITQ